MRRAFMAIMSASVWEEPDGNVSDLDGGSLCQPLPRG